jgi:hypothetical protein
MYLIYSPVTALVAYTRGRGGRAGAARVGLLTIGCLAVVLPWSVFITAREGSPILLCSNGGETLAGGLNPELLRIEREYGTLSYTAPSGRTNWIGPGKWLNDYDTGYLSPQEQRLPLTQKGNLLTRRALSWVCAHPRDAAYLTLRKLLYMWGIYPFWNGLAQTTLGNVPLLVLLCLAAASLFRLRRHFRDLTIFWTLPVFVTLVALISLGSWRYRQPGDLGLILLASALPFATSVEAALGRSRGSLPEPEGKGP